MNFPKAFEGAWRAAFAETADLSELPRIRCWQAIDLDGRWSRTDDKALPVIGVRAVPPRTNTDDGFTQECDIAISIGTRAEDDASHKNVATYYDAVAKCCDNLYAQFLSQTPGQERTAWNSYLQEQEPDLNAILNIGGFTHGDGQEPYLEAGVNFIGILFIVHYSRSDYTH